MEHSKFIELQYFDVKTIIQRIDGNDIQTELHFLFESDFKLLYYLLSKHKNEYDKFNIQLKTHEIEKIKLLIDGLQAVDFPINKKDFINAINFEEGFGCGVVCESTGEFALINEDRLIWCRDFYNDDQIILIGFEKGIVKTYFTEEGTKFLKETLNIINESF